MPVDNTIYDGPGDLWWDENQPLHALGTGLNPARLEYFRRVFALEGFDPAGRSIVDIGCGGGLLAEELARLRARVTGIDPSEPSLATARAHAAGAGLEIAYLAGTGERLPLPDACMDAACCVDVLEHVSDLDAVIGETARVLRPGGLFLYDTINRTLLSRLVMITIFQDWRATACAPPGLHDWHRFVTPAELTAVLGRHGLQHRDTVEIFPAAPLPVLWRLLRQLKGGRISYAEFGRRTRLSLTTGRLGRPPRISYAGYAVLNGG